MSILQKIFPLLLLSLFVSCSGSSLRDHDPSLLMEDAEYDIEHERYSLALEKLRELKNKFPYSNYSAIAQLRLGDVYYLQESYIEAVSAYEVFTELHPKHEKIDYAYFRVGLSYLESTPSNIARDQSNASKAQKAFETFLLKFPKSPFSSEAQEKKKISTEKLSKKELYIAKFYERQDEYLSALKRYENIRSIYPETPEAKVAEEKIPLMQQKIDESKEDEE